MSESPASEACLDGRRGILLVLAAHLLPLGPKSLSVNATAGPMDMALFFTLSGFLITWLLLHHPMHFRLPDSSLLSDRAMRGRAVAIRSRSMRSGHYSLP